MHGALQAKENQKPKKSMGYYLTTISISLMAKNDDEATLKIEKILNGARENKDCKPYVSQIKKADNKNKFVKLEDSIIKQLNIKKQ
jgi:hypothetical protein